ncbi:MAG: alpha/beta fold hydrolase [Candidatus Eisenbacteria bacterium]|nr:alpha/beta fold hydrolase [Candidatus Eisenbacteria bacterium]
MRVRTAAAACAVIAALVCAAPARAGEGDWTITDFTFRSGEKLAALRLHYLTLGQPIRNARGEVTNAVLIIHGTGGNCRSLMVRQFADTLFRAGAPLDTARFYVIMPDCIGHGHSSKPSDGLHMRFPHYDYDDMVEADYRTLTEHLGVHHLRLVLGTSMGAMHAWVWGETHPTFMDALMPLASLPTAIVGRNRLWRDMAAQAIREDPEWKDGEYTSPPRAGMRAAIDMLIIAGAAPLPMQRQLANRDTVDRYLEAQIRTRMASTDANDLIYQLDASRSYNPEPGLAKITAPLTAINSGDDFINPPELGIAERLIQQVPHGKFVLIPASEQTHGHGTHTWPALWKEHLVALLAASAH